MFLHGAWHERGFYERRCPTKGRRGPASYATRTVQRCVNLEARIEKTSNCQHGQASDQHSCDVSSPSIWQTGDMFLGRRKLTLSRAAHDDSLNVWQAVATLPKEHSSNLVEPAQDSKSRQSQRKSDSVPSSRMRNLPANSVDDCYANCVLPRVPYQSSRLRNQFIGLESISSWATVPSCRKQLFLATATAKTSTCRH